MQMEFGTAMVGIIVVAMMAMPFILDSRRRRRTSAVLRQKLETAAHAQRCTLHQLDVHGEIAIGMDTQRKMVFFLDQQEPGTGLQQVNLAQVRTCQVAKTGRGAKSAQQEEHIERVELNLVPREKAAGEVRLVLFQAAFGNTVEGEVQLAEKWAALVNAQLKN